MQSLEQIVASNITTLRKNSGWTQAELAEKINYPDKSVSKWERGEALPDLKVIKQLADLWGIPVDSLLTPGGAESYQNYISPKTRRNYLIWVTVLFAFVVWLIATAVYVYTAINTGNFMWQAFIWAVPVSCIVVSYCDRRFFGKVLTVYTHSILVWSLITAIFLQWLDLNMWMLYLIAIPAQAIIILLSHIQKIKNM